MRRRSVLPAILLIFLATILFSTSCGCKGRRAPSSNPDVIKSAVNELRKTCDRVKSGRGSCEFTSVQARAGKTIYGSVKYKGAFDGDRFRVSIVGIGDGRPVNKREVTFDGKTIAIWDKLYPKPLGSWTKIRTATSMDSYGGNLNPVKQTDTFWTGGWGEKDLSHMKVAGYEKLNGDRCLVVEESREEDVTVVKWWLDAEKGYLPMKFECLEEKGSGKPLRILEERYDIRDYGNRLWAPAKVVTTFYDEEGKMASRSTVVYSKDLKLNVPIRPEELELEIPAGVKERK